MEEAKPTVDINIQTSPVSIATNSGIQVDLMLVV